MKCQGCGHDYPSTLTRCTRCGQITPRRGQKTSQSRLIEFPRRTRAVEEKAAEASLPAWRVELNEKVRAIRAKRDMTGASPARIEDEIQPDGQAAALEPQEATLSAARQRARSSANGAASRIVNNRLEGEPAALSAGQATSTTRGNNTIVEAALTRVRRASENASRAQLPKIEPARPYNSLAVDKEATARALEPEIEQPPKVEQSPKASPRIPPISKVSQQAAATSQAAAAPATAATAPSTATGADVMTAELYKPALPTAATAALVEEPAHISIAPIDEIEPMDYLEAEVKKVDRALSAEFLRNESPSAFSHIVLNLVDLLAIALSCAPFLALAGIADGRLNESRLAVALILALVSLFYFAVTQCLCGKTFGMMLTNTRVVDAYNFDAASNSKLLVRSIGYFIALAPAALGLLCILFNRKHRGLHDLISGTLVARDF